MKKEIKHMLLDQNNPRHVRWMFNVRSHPEVKKHLLNPPSKTFSVHERNLKNSITSGKKRFFIVYLKEEMAGYCHLTLSDESIELGWALHPDFWGKGIGKESITFLLQYVYQSGLAKEKKIHLFVKKDNLRAISIYKKSGFVITCEDQLGYQMEFVNP